MENAPNRKANEFYIILHVMHKVRNGNPSVSISFCEPPYRICPDIKVKMELCASSVINVPFSFSGLGCHDVTLTLFIPSALLQATSTLSLSRHTNPESHFHVFCLPKHLSFTLLPSREDRKPKPSQFAHTRITVLSHPQVHPGLDCISA